MKTHRGAPLSEDEWDERVREACARAAFALAGTAGTMARFSRATHEATHAMRAFVATLEQCGALDD